MSSDAIHRMSATELVGRVRRKELSPVEVAEATLRHVEALNPELNAFCTLTPEIAMAQAREAESAVMRGEAGPLCGVPFSVKDLLLTRGVRTMRGSHINANFIPEEDAPVVTRLAQAGGIMLGKTTTPEYGWKGVTDSPLTGITRNPWNPAKTPGGSSGGASAQVAAGMGPLAIGTDGGGSIRIPSAFTGIFGIKPTFGRVPVYPGSAHDMLSHTGPMTRTVADAALMLAVMAGPHPSDRLCLDGAPDDYVGRLGEGIQGLRVAWSADLGFADVHPDVLQRCREALPAFEEAGCVVEEWTPDFPDCQDAFIHTYLGGLGASLGSQLAKWRDQLDPGLVTCIEASLELTAGQLTSAQIRRLQYYDQMRLFFERYDLLLTPAVAQPAFDVGRLTPDGSGDVAAMFGWTPFSYQFNYTGHPAASVPVGFTAGGLPVGLQIVGPRFADLRVLQASAVLESMRPWAQHWPGMVS